MANTTNYSKITPGAMVRRFTKLYARCVNGDVVDFSKEPTKMLWGAPGIGKSQAVHQLVNELGELVHRRVNVTVASLLLMNPIDLRGIPTKAEDEAGNLVARWLTPEIFKMDPSNGVVNALFLDEISAAPPSVQAAAYQIALERRIGEHMLPKNCFVICAGNRVTDKAVAYKMPKPLGNRMTHFEMIPDVASWIAWAVSNDIDPRIVGYIKWQPDQLNSFSTENDDVAFQTPRSWELANSYLRSFGEDFDGAFDFISGSIGLSNATQFRAYVNVFTKLPNFADVKAGKFKELPKGIDKTHPDVTWACSAMVSSNLIREIGERTSSELMSSAQMKTTIANVAKFLTLMPKEYAVSALRDILMTRKNAKSAIISVKETTAIIDDLADIISQD